MFSVCCMICFFSVYYITFHIILEVFLCHSHVQIILNLQGLLALEGELTPILVQMVKSANMNGLLDSDSDSLNSCQQRVKARLHEILQKDRDFSFEDYEKVWDCFQMTGRVLKTVQRFMSCKGIFALECVFS